MDSTWEQAARHGDAEQLAALSASVDLNARDGHGQTALMLAAHAGHAAAVRVLLVLGADANHTAKHGLTALMLAVLGGHAEVVQALLDGGADTTRRGTGAPGFANQTALDLAGARGDAAIVAMLRRAEASP